jgi:acyl transferase domain-containing protein/3-hydroxymyristoyl/3-hydroxydecanoyl-(acyl carrier protein) dehydratase
MKVHTVKKIGKIAVVGMAGVFPQALDIQQFLDNILHKKDAVITVPDYRWPGPVNDFISHQILPDKAVSSKAGLIENFNFDSAGFCVDKDLLSGLDPLHKLVLHAGRQAFLQCSHTKEDKRRTGVILAAIALPTDTSSRISRQIICKDNTKIFPEDFLGAGVVSLPAAILSRAMGLQGGCFTLDAACASSLYAIKLACEHLSLKKADIMVAGGVSRPDSLYTQIGFTQIQALSPSGRCSPFDKNADGLVVGEGTGIVVLKRLQDAIDSGDKIHAVISGAGVSNDIAGNLVAPASEGQVRAMVQAFEQASWSPSDIQYMECHGSGTLVGDQVELSSIKALLDTFDCPDKILSIGSVKSMIGHLLTAAGAAGFIKTILSMNEGCVPPSLNYSGPGPGSILNEGRIRVQTRVEDWKPESSHTTRKAGISAFGFGGINAHLLVEEFKPDVFHHIVKIPDKKESLKNVPCAIIGMETIAKDCHSLSQFKDLVFERTSLTPEYPGSRWRREKPADFKEIPGFYLDDICLSFGEFHIPPNQMEDILPQHILILKAVRGALEDAKINPRPASGEPLRHDMGGAIGIEFDYGSTDFHLRWKINHLDEKLKDALSPPLTFNRTLGALGGIAASRVAREFKLGGPCFTLSAGAASGIKAIETGVHSLSRGETSVFICGCVDLAGDIRQSILNDIAKPHGQLILPSEGACAIVLKRLDQALEDGDQIYGVITGVAGAGGGTIPGETQDGSNLLENLYTTSLKGALKESKTAFGQMGLYEACFTGIHQNDAVEAKVLNRLGLKDPLALPCHVTSTSCIIGNTRTASALFSVIKTALCLDHKYLPSNKKEALGFKKMDTDRFRFIDTPAQWNNMGPGAARKACVASITMDGACSHVILEESCRQDKFVAGTGFFDKKKPRIKISLKKDIILKTNSRPVSEKILKKINVLVAGDKINSHYIERTPIIEDPDQGRVKGIFENKLMENGFAIDPSLVSQGSHAISSAHEKFLEFSKENYQAFEKQFEALNRIAGNVIHGTDKQLIPDDLDTFKTNFQTRGQAIEKPAFLDREQCLEYARGKAGNVLGKEFEIIDTYPVRVRLPDEPLMLVDRIMDIKGEMLSLTSGKIITQHDVKENAWYLDGGKAPVSISIEAGQADLFLCAWLGIDHRIKGTRKYRLLDAKVTFHRSLPEPFETIEYHIEIDRFLKQGDVYLFFFHYKGYINHQLLISMKDGCAGFFTEQEVENSGGIILKADDLKEILPPGKFFPLVPVKKEGFSDEKVEALRKGDLGEAFGENFENIHLGKKLKLPGGKMHLIDRVLSFDPTGGRFGLGAIIAQADIHPDVWFLTCHFVDDRVMPGTLMYECCAHALRIFTQRMGWVSDRDDVFYDVVPDNESDLKCRGPVTPDTKKARYEIEIKEMGYDPEPYIIADAHMFSDELRIILYKNMGMKLVGLTKSDLESFWRKQ